MLKHGDVVEISRIAFPSTEDEERVFVRGKLAEVIDILETQGSLKFYGCRILCVSNLSVYLRENMLVLVASEQPKIDI
jgi:hypothetical protein